MIKGRIRKTKLRHVASLAAGGVFAAAVMAANAPKVHAGAGDFIGGVGAGIILNEVLRGGNSQSNGNSDRGSRHRDSGSRRHSAPRAYNTETHEAQKALTTLGFYSGAIDGDKGPKTQAAIRSYQESKQIPATGALSEEQRGLLQAEANLYDSYAYLGAPDYAPASQRDQKKRVQAALKALGHYDGSIDGVFGGGTSRAVRSYQASQGYPQTGTLSPEQEEEAIATAREQLEKNIASIDNQFATIASRHGLSGQPERAVASGRNERMELAKTADDRFPAIEPIKEGITPVRKNDVAVVIGNKSYDKDIPEVAFGHRDAQGMRSLLVNELGFSPDNIIWAEDAGQAEMLAIFGSPSNHKGKLWRYIDPEGQSNVMVFYSGHGAPDVNTKTPYLLPVDTDPNAIAINGYSLDQMYANLGKLNTKSVTVMLDACFSGGSHKGMLIKSASPVMVSTDMAKASGQKNLTILAAADGNQLASWDEKNGHGLFTGHLMSGMKGGADTNSDGKITAGELHDYVHDGVQRQARRDFGREQTPKLIGDPNAVVRVTH